MRYIVLYALFLNTLLFAVSGAEVFKNKCSSCHSYYIPQSKLLSNFMEHNNTELNLKAPALNQLSFAFRAKIGDREDDVESQKMFLEEFLEEYLNNPDKSRGVVSKKITKHFETMPSLKGQIEDEEIEALADYIYDYGEDMMIKHGVKRYSMNEALKVAKNEGKIVIIEGFIPFCSWCIKLDREVMVNTKVKDILNKDFVLVKTNLLIEKLPLGMKRLSTPSFYFISSDGKKIIDMVEGAGTVDEFLELLESVKNKK